MITEVEKNKRAKILSDKYDFFRRLEGRLGVQRDRLKQTEKALLEKTNDKNKEKIFLTKIEGIKYCISEMEFIRNNIIDDFYYIK